MPCYLVSYDLRQPEHDYDALYAAIRSYGQWAHLKETLWAVVTDRTTTQVREHLRQFVDENDRLTVARYAAAEAGSPPPARTTP